MRDELFKMFREVHGDITKGNSIYLIVNNNSVHVMKDGELCWKATKLDLLFDYVVKKTCRT